MESPLINRGTGAGGKNTNVNGLSFESTTDMTHEIPISSSLIDCSKRKLFQLIGYDKNVSKMHGCKQPDECYVDKTKNLLFIIEKKFQQCSGSVCEKLQTVHAKLWNYQRLFPIYKIIYIYVLSDWFKENCKEELDYLKFMQIPVFWGSSHEYKPLLFNFMQNYQ